MNARHPNYDNSPHIDPGDPPTEVSHNHDFSNPCLPGCPRRPRNNPDPINAWRPGSVEAQREAHFRPVGGESLGVRNPHAQKVHVTQAEMGPLPDAIYTDADVMPKAKPEREGPDYAGESAVDRPYMIDIQFPSDLITPRMQWILDQVVVGVLGEFVRHNLQYGDTDMSLGYQGQFAELFHIISKLKRLMWDNNYAGLSTNGGHSQMQRDLESLIGHALLALDLLDKGNRDGK